VHACTQTHFLLSVGIWKWDYYKRKYYHDWASLPAMYCRCCQAIVCRNHKAAPQKCI